MGNKNERKIAVNKEIVLMRQAVRKTKLGINWKLTKESQRLKSRQHGDEKVIKKCKRKGGNLIKELRVLKKIKDDEISKYAITNDKSLTEVLSDPKAKLKTKILTRMAFHKILKTRVEEFKKKFPDYLEFMGPGRRERSKIEFIEKKNAAKNTDGDESNKDKKSDNDEKNMIVEGNDNHSDNEDDGDDDDDDNDDNDNEEEAEDEEENQSEINESESEKDTDDEDDDEDEEDEDDEEDKNENDDNDDADKTSNKNKEKDTQKIEKDNKVLMNEEETLITQKTDEKKSKKANNLLPKKDEIKEKNKTEEPVSLKTENSPDKNIKRKSEAPINRERVVKKFKLDEEQDEIAIDTADNLDPIDSSEEDTNAILTNDPFFHPGGLTNRNESNKRSNNYSNNNDNNQHNNLNRRSRRALLNNKNNNEIKNDYPNKQGRSISSNDNYAKKYNNKFTKQNDYKFNSNDMNNKFNDKISKPTIEKDLHPSWVAKKQQQVIIKQGFQGKKIVFDN